MGLKIYPRIHLWPIVTIVIVMVQDRRNNAEFQSFQPYHSSFYHTCQWSRKQTGLVSSSPSVKLAGRWLVSRNFAPVLLQLSSASARSIHHWPPTFQSLPCSAFTHLPVASSSTWKWLTVLRSAGPMDYPVLSSDFSSRKQPGASTMTHKHSTLVNSNLNYWTKVIFSLELQVGCSRHNIFNL